MPDSITNGYSNGHMPYDMEDGSNFLFTSESVGEGHPGKLKIYDLFLKMAIRQHIDALHFNPKIHYL